jgi:hypothetical protein
MVTICARGVERLRTEENGIRCGKANSLEDAQVNRSDHFKRKMSAADEVSCKRRGHLPVDSF